MTQTEYEQKKRECWEEYVNLLNNNSATRYMFDKVFDRAYALGKQTETVTQEEIEKAALDYIRTNPFVNFRTATTARESFVDGANFTLGKQEKDADTMIQGWACRDNNSLNAQVLIGDKPKRTGYNYWENKYADCITLPKGSFSDLTWESEPEQVELIIKRKKNE